MKKENIVVIGSSGHAKVVIDVIEKEGKYRIVGLVDSYKQGIELIYGFGLMGAEDVLKPLVANGTVSSGFIAIGDNWKRHLMADKIKALVPEFKFISAIHPSAQIARGVKIGEGTVVMAGVVVNSDSQIGDFCILNTNASLDHDCVMEDFSSLAPNATTGGNVMIGAFSAISLGANIVHGHGIGKHTVIGAGALVLDDIPDYCIAYGTPAKVIRKRQEGERYL
jgi:sugar O-acyltransferase (sialic acid O-acetyltransferase NeuD family)